MLNDPIDLNAYRSRKKAQQADQKKTSWLTRFLTWHKPARMPTVSADVLCARCHEPILRNARRCEHCGVYFSGYADDFTPTPSSALWTKLIIGLLIAAILAAMIVAV